MYLSGKQSAAIAEFADGDAVFIHRPRVQLPAGHTGPYPANQYRRVFVDRQEDHVCVSVDEFGTVTDAPRPWPKAE